MSDAGQPNGSKSSSRKRMRRRQSVAPGASSPASASTRFSGGRYQPLNQNDVEKIHTATLDILENIGVADMPVNASEYIVSAGGHINTNNRLCIPKPLVKKALAGIKKPVTLHGRLPGNELVLDKKRVFVGTGGAAPLVSDLHTGEFRESTLADLHDAARLADALEHVHFFSRSMVARDMPDSLSLDINTAYACLNGTAKHVMMSASNKDSVESVAKLCWMIAGSQQRFTEQPFLSLNINHAVSPLRVSEEAIEVLIRGAQLGIPVHTNTFSQLGASTPVTIAGCVAQTMAETITGMILAWLVNPEALIICGPRPMLTDLRTGAMSGGSGEQALLTAAVIQMTQYYGFSNSTIAGASDSKLADAQSGYEKSLAVTLAAHAGANLITQACGVQASLMVCSFESFVIDNDMLGSILRSLAPIDVSQETLDISEIQKAVDGDGHFLGHQQTYDRMQTDFLYPDIANRDSHEVWAMNGSTDIRTVANDRAKSILSNHVPNYINSQVDQEIRSTFDIRINRD